jgi:hypothetical protein
VFLYEKLFENEAIEIWRIGNWLHTRRFDTEGCSGGWEWTWAPNVPAADLYGNGSGRIHSTVSEEPRDSGAAKL